MSLWRTRLARSAVNRKVGGSSPPRDVPFYLLKVLSCNFRLSPRSESGTDIVLGEGLLPRGLQKACTLREETAVSSVFIRILIPALVNSYTLRNSSKPNYLPKAPHPNTVTLGS